MKRIVRRYTAPLLGVLLVALGYGCGGGGGGNSSPPTVVGSWRFAQVTFTDGSQADVPARAMADEGRYYPSFVVELRSDGTGRCVGDAAGWWGPWELTGRWSVDGSRLSLTIERGAFDTNGDLTLTADEWQPAADPAPRSGTFRFDGADRLHLTLPPDVFAGTDLAAVLMQRVD
jgi:hypothetical protein